MMSGHIYVAASGFGKRVIPKAPPFHFSINAEGSLVLGVAESKPSIIRSDQSVEAAQAVALDAADVTLGPDWSAWWLLDPPVPGAAAAGLDRARPREALTPRCLTLSDHRTA